MEERAKRIVETAVALAEEGGFEAVRLRDVANHAGVAMGTLYRRFRSKEDLLVAALDLETREMERRVERRPPAGESELERVASFFSIATRGSFDGRTSPGPMVKAAASGDRDLTKQVASFHQRVERMVINALRGPEAKRVEDSGAAELEARLARNLNLFWFALMVGWSGGLHTQEEVIEGMQSVAELLLRGARS